MASQALFDIKAPSVGESITEVRILKWTKPDGAAVNLNEVVLEIESDKATVEVVAEAKGVLKIFQPEGSTVPVGAVIGGIMEGTGTTVAQAPAAKAQASTQAAAPTQSPAPAQANVSGGSPSASASPNPQMALAPSVRKIVSENNLNPSSITGTGLHGQITKGDALAAVSSPGLSKAPAAPTQAPAPTTSSAPTASPATATSPVAQVRDSRDKRQPMSSLRARIATRLVAAQHTAAILTTFNEVDLSAVNALRTQHKEAFKSKHGVGLGYMSFFSRAICEALTKDVPMVNGSLDGSEIITRDYVDLGIAVGSPRGLVVPIIREAQTMGFVEIEKAIAGLAQKAKDGKLSIKELSGGTFTISNGGTYGSMLSTPILTPPQTGILGMHKIQDRPVAVDGQVVIRPMMFLALSYDHRLIDGKEAVTFLVKVKEYLEHPETLNLSF